MHRTLIAALTVALLGAPAFAQDRQTRVTVQADQEGVRDVLRRLEREHGLNYVVSEEVLARAGTVTCSLRDVPLEDALQAICAAAGLSITFRGSIGVILPVTERAPLPSVPEGVLGERDTFVPRRAAPAPARQPERQSAPPVREAAPPPRPANLDDSAMAIGSVVEVDLPNHRLQLMVDGAKRDFYLPDVEGGDPKLQAARLGQALTNLKAGYRVALLYRVEDGQSVLTDLIGGSQSSGREKRAGAKAPKITRRTAPAAPPTDRTAPESTLLPEGVLAGRFVSRDGDAVQVRKSDDSVVTCYVPPEGEDRRAKVLAVVEGLTPEARVYLTYERVDGRLVIKDSGITESK